MVAVACVYLHSIDCLTLGTSYTMSDISGCAFPFNDTTALEIMLLISI
jgi:hypothetical protein